jgi:hypothetical protein
MLKLKLKPEYQLDIIDYDKPDEGLVYIPIELINEFITNPLGSLRDFACIPTNAISPFFTDTDKLDLAVAGNFNPFDSTTRTFEDNFLCGDSFFRYIHVDLGWKKDGLGIAMCHIPYWINVSRAVEDKETKEINIEDVLQPFIKFDFVGRILAEGKTEILISTAQDLILELAYQRNFYVHLATFDRFESVQTLQNLREKGFNVAHLSIDKTAYKILVDYEKDDFIGRETTDKQYNAAMENLRYAIQEERVAICEHEDWYEETRGSEYLADKNKVVKSPHSSDDLIQAIAGAAFNAVNNELPETAKPRELEESARDTTYDKEDYKTQYDYNNEVPAQIRHSNYRVGIS